jgi:dTMP kinase
MAAGRFITFEGGEGSGKSTQARALAERLESQGIEVVLTREPGGSPFAEALRAVILDPEMPQHSALSEALLFYAARADHLDKTIRPALNAGRWVICDRFSDSTRVYQSEAGGLPGEVLDVLEEMVVSPTKPDLTVILDLPAELGLGRAHGRRMRASDDPSAADAPDAYERRDLAFHWQLRSAFAAIAKAEPQRCVLIDAAEEPAAIGDAIWDAVSTRLLQGAA